MHAGPCQLAGLGILPGSLTRLDVTLFDIEQVIDHLEHQTDRVAVVVHVRKISPTPADGPNSARGPDQGSGLRGGNRLEPGGVPETGLTESERVEDLPAHHARRRRPQFADQDARQGRVVGRGQPRERVCEHRVTRQDRHRLAGMDVQGRASTTQVVVVHCRQVVVDEAEGVDEFDRDAGVEGPVTVGTDLLAPVPRQERSQALATREGGVSHRLDERRGDVEVVERRLEPGLDAREGSRHLVVEPHAAS